MKNISLKEANEERNRRWIATGGKTRKYKCPICLKELERNVPKNPGEVWDSAMTCYECDGIYFAVVPYKGKIRVEAILL